MRGRTVLGALLWASCWLAVSGCGAQESTPTTPPSEETSSGSAAAEPVAATGAVEAAREIYATRCVTCHGTRGAGDGPGSAALDPAPRDFRDAAWQSSVDDAHIEQIIQYGGAAVGRSPAMPGNPDLAAKPEIVAELRAYIRSLGAN